MQRFQDHIGIGAKWRCFNNKLYMDLQKNRYRKIILGNDSDLYVWMLKTTAQRGGLLKGKFLH